MRNERHYLAEDSVKDYMGDLSVRQNGKAASFAARLQCLYRKLATQPAAILLTSFGHDWTELKLCCFTRRDADPMRHWPFIERWLYAT